MANFHLRDKSLSLKAVGLLSKMLSFNDGWKFSTKGLSAICKEGPDAILSALRELETVSYTHLDVYKRQTYAELAIGEYEHWEEEEWVDVANPDWQKFIGQLSQELYEKGVDGFFIDNCDYIITIRTRVFLKALQRFYKT